MKVAKVIKIKDHLLEKDSLQFILNHPASCTNKGSSWDKRKTYFPGWMIDQELGLCGLKPTPAELDIIKSNEPKR